MADYHPTDEFLIQFSAGKMPDALGLMIACHLEECPRCQSRSRLFEQVGGELLQQSADQPVSDTLLANVLNKLDIPSVAVDEGIPHTSQSIIPRPLQRFIQPDYAQLKWSGMTRSIKEITLPFSDKQYTAKLYKIAAGKELPEHTHCGNEFTLVMQGSFSDKAGYYRRGDFIQADNSTVHQPKASEDQDCICFAVLDDSLKMTGFFGRWLNPFL